MTEKQLFEKLNRQGVFWSYDVNTITDITDKLLIEHALLYGDVDEIKALFGIFDSSLIRQVWEKHIVPDSRKDKLNYFLASIFFRIENPTKFLAEISLTNSRYEKLKRFSEKH